MLALRERGVTEAQITENIVGMFYDSVPLMKAGQAKRHETISLVKAMVRQALTASAAMHDTTDRRTAAGR